MQISELVTLKRINLDDNKLSEFPEVLFKLQMLQYVQLSGNQFNILPNFEDHWSFLEELYLDKCHLEVSLTYCYH